MAGTVRRSVICPCGGNWYEDTYAIAGADEGQAEVTMTPVWRCANCFRESKRTTRQRDTNKAKALKAYQAISAEWEPTDRDLDALIAEGDVKSGVLLVHAQAFNYHLGKLLSIPKPTTFELGYHTASAHKDLQAAQRFVAARRGLTVEK